MRDGGHDGRGGPGPRRLGRVSRTRRLTIVLLLAWVGLGLAPGRPACGDTDEEGRAFARQQLIEDARQAIGTGNLQSGALVGLRKTLRDDGNFYTAYDPKPEEEALYDTLRQTLEERKLFLGATDDDDADSSDVAQQGALVEADLLLRWLKGEERCGVGVQVLKRGEPSGPVVPYPYEANPPAPVPAPTAAAPVPGTAPAPSTPAPSTTAPSEAPGASGPAPAGPPPAAPAPVPRAPGGDTKPPAAPIDPLSPAPAEAPAVGDATSLTPPPETAGDPDAWKKWVLVHEKGTLRNKQILPLECQEQVTDLLNLAKRAPQYAKDAPDDLSTLQRFVIVEPDPFAYNRPFLWLRREQADQRLKAIDAEDPTTGILDETTVREKSVRAQRYREQADRRAAERQSVLDLLDRIAVEVGHWRSLAAYFSTKIEEQKSREGAPEGTAPSRSLALRVLEAQESLASLDLRMISHTVLRADERRQLLDSLLEIEKKEAEAAEAKSRAFAARLQDLRNQRQLGRLQFDALQLREDIRREEARHPKPGSPGALRITARQAVLDLSAVVEEAVKRRRTLSEAATTAAGSKSSEAAPATTETKSGAEGETVAAPRRELSPSVRDPRAYRWDLGLIQTARRALEDPELYSAFGADEVALHYEVATQQIRRLEAALTATEGDQALRDRFDVAGQKADAALGALAAADPWYAAYRLPERVEALRKDFSQAMEAIEGIRARYRDLLQATRAYQKLLLHQGTRSLSIRYHDEMDPADLVGAIEDTAGGVAEAARFLGGNGDPSLSGWVGAHLVSVVLSIAAVVLLALVVAFGRRRIDRWIEDRAARIQHLRWSGAGVSSERIQEKARKEQEAQAKATAEERLQGVQPASEEPEAPESGPEEADGPAVGVETSETSEPPIHRSRREPR